MCRMHLLKILAVIGRTGIGPIREIFVYCIDRFDNIKANKSRLITAGLGPITRPIANMKDIT
jgi:hypothetical protein